MPTRIDDSHTPFKRMRALGPGPKKRPPVKQTRRWVCIKAPPKKQKKGYYTQLCRSVDTGRIATIRTDKDEKKKYMKEYRVWRSKSKAPRFSRTARISTYRCRKTRTTKCK